MSTLTANSHSDAFSKYVIYSITAHLLLVAVFTVKTYFFSDEPILLESAIRVDMVALPDKISPDEMPAPTTPQVEEKAKAQPLPPKEKAHEPETVKLEKTKKKENRAFEKLKQLSALEELEKQVKTEELKKSRTYKGNAIAKGSDLKGIAKLQHDEYVTLLRQQILDHWALPSYMRNKNLKAEVLIKIDERGFIIEKRVYKSSGNPTFDEIAINTVQKASPVSAPPEKFVRISSTEGFLIRFSE